MSGGLSAQHTLVVERPVARSASKSSKPFGGARGRPRAGENTRIRDSETSRARGALGSGGVPVVFDRAAQYGACGGAPLQTRPSRSGASQRQAWSPARLAERRTRMRSSRAWRNGDHGQTNGMLCRISYRCRDPDMRKRAHRGGTQKARSKRASARTRQAARVRQAARRGLPAVKQGS